MGWTGMHTDYYDKRGNVDRKMACRAEYSRYGCEVLKDSIRGSVYYAAVKHPDGHVFGLVMHTIVNNDDYYNFSYKDIDEGMGPHDYDCPIGILNLLSDTDNEFALEWREKCRAKQGRPAKSALPVGTIISFTFNDKEMIAVKRAPAYQFKRTWWYLPESGRYVASRYIGEFKVLTEEEAKEKLGRR